MPLILPGNVGSATAATGFNVANSLRFNSGSSDRLNKTLGTPTNNLKWTYSFWIKRSKLGEEVAITEALNDSQNKGIILFRSDDKLEILDLISDSYVMQKKTNRVFRDTASWYHIVFSNDSTAGSPDLKIYVNGVEETSFATDNEYSQNQAGSFNSAIANHIGASASSRFSNCYFSQFVFIDGLALAADQFGEFDSDSAIWKPIDVSGLTFGDNGFFLKFEESGTGTDANGMGADSSGNTNHFAVNNLTAVDQSTDTCTNNFATWNNLLGITIPDTFTEGNLVVARSSGSWTATFSTIAASSGKFYAEVKWVQGSEFTTGFGNAQSYASDHDLNDLVSDPGGGGYLSVIYKNGVLYENGSNTGTGYSTYASGDIIMLAMDLDNYKLYLGVGGTWGNSGDPAGNSNGVAIPSAYQGDFFHFAVNVHSSNTTTASGNFGSPQFAISSGNTDGNGYGNFEYAVPSGFYSLNTKNLAEYG